MTRTCLLVPLIAALAAAGCRDNSARDSTPRRTAGPAAAEAPDVEWAERAGDPAGALAADEADPARADRDHQDTVLAGGAPLREPDVIFEPTPQRRVDAMLAMARVRPGEKVYDLGCGDGRIAITAAKKFRAHAVCIDIDPERVAEARANVAAAGVADRVEVRLGDLFETDLSDADVVTLYLLQELNERLRPTLLRDLRPGSRVVSHVFDMGDWKPDAEKEIDGGMVYLWRIR
jgi:SAM-dependent methyltransferase